jgi:integrase
MYEYQMNLGRPMTLRTVLDGYERDVLVHVRDAMQQRRMVRWWVQAYGTTRVAALTREILVGMRECVRAVEVRRGCGLATPRSAGTVNRYMAILLGALRHWAGQGGEGASPWVPRLRKLPEPPGRVRYLEAQEAGALLRACRVGPAYLHDIVLIALVTGMRRGELLGLTWHDVNLSRGAVVLQATKNGERRSVPLAGVAAEVLARRHRMADGSLTERVFEGTGGLYRAFQKAVERAGIRDFRFHDLRHTTASWLAMDGRSTIEIAEVLGHKTLAMVKRYAHLAPNHRVPMMNAMAERYLPSVTTANGQGGGARGNAPGLPRGRLP